jgi:HEAT repeat protein
LTDGLSDPDASVRLVFASALALAGNPASLSALTRLCEDPAPEVRAAADRALSAIGPADEEHGAGTCDEHAARKEHPPTAVE